MHSCHAMCTCCHCTYCCTTAQCLLPWPLSEAVLLHPGDALSDQGLHVHLLLPCRLPHCMHNLEATMPVWRSALNAALRCHRAQVVFTPFALHACRCVSE